MEGMFDSIKYVICILVTIVCTLIGYIACYMLSNKSPVKYDCIHFAIDGEKKVVCVAHGDISVFSNVATVVDPTTGIQYTISPPYSIVPLNEVALTGEK